MSSVFFTDRDLGRKFPDILISAGITVERHGDHFADNAQDEEWIPDVAARNWVAITHDKRIRYKPNEKAAVFGSGLALLVLIGAAPYPDLARNFVYTIDRIESFLSRNNRPFIARVYRASESERKRNPSAAGRIEMWMR